MNINELGFIRIGASAPKVKIAECDYNVSEIKKVIEQALQNKVQILCFPELTITSYSCGDLFFQKELLDKATTSLIELSEFVKQKENIIVIVGFPYQIKNSLFNMAAVLSEEGIIGMIPKTYLANSNEFQEKRWFASKTELWESSVIINEKHVPVSQGNMLFYTP